MIHLQPHSWDAICRHAQDTFPEECCGAILRGAVVQEVDSGSAALKAFYHSHPNHDAYFSAEDKARAMFGDEPSYPEAVHLVISIYGREVRAIRAYVWEEGARDFVETELSTDV